MKNKTPEERAQSAIDRMASIYKKGALHMLPTTFGHAVMELLQNGIPVTNQSLMDYFVTKLDSAPGSPIEEYFREAIDQLGRHSH